MLLSKVQITSYKSIEDSGEVPISERVTVLVGQNESGKTAFLEALYKARPATAGSCYDVTSDYPRKNLTQYKKLHAVRPAVVACLTFAVQPDEITRINEDLEFKLLKELQVQLSHHYENGCMVGLEVPERDFVIHLTQKAQIPPYLGERIDPDEGLRGLVQFLSQQELSPEARSFFEEVKAKFQQPADSNWNNWLACYIWRKHLSPALPKFLYFDDYYLLPGKVNIKQLQEREAGSASNPALLDAADRTTLAFLRMADVQLSEFTDPTGYESIKAKLEAVSNSMTDQLFKYWKQNSNLDVEIDVRSDANDRAPFNEGPNLYIRIRNRRHRVSVPFSQRSKGFIWFFSFLTWFGSIAQDPAQKRRLILLLDEPGLSLHALAQEDFLGYIDALAADHQILYTTHSPFMVHSDRLHEVRTVEDKPELGTIVSASVSNSDPNTIFPLQAALGYTLAQNLFISKRNLLVEGPADLIYLQFFSRLLEDSGRTHLRDDITLVPAGGLDKIATFVALLKGNALEFAVLHDFNKQPDQRLDQLVRERLVKKQHVLHFAQFRAATDGGKMADFVATDIEDLVSIPLYLQCFVSAFAQALNGAHLTEADLPPGDRVLHRLERYLEARNIQLRPAGGFNHYSVANHLAAHPVPATDIDSETLDRFERIFKTVNALFTV